MRPRHGPPHTPGRDGCAAARWPRARSSPARFVDRAPRRPPGRRPGDARGTRLPSRPGRRRFASRRCPIDRSVAATRATYPFSCGRGTPIPKVIESPMARYAPPPGADDSDGSGRASELPGAASHAPATSGCRQCSRDSVRATNHESPSLRISIWRSAASTGSAARSVSRIQPTTVPDSVCDARAASAVTRAPSAFDIASISRCGLSHSGPPGPKGDVGWPSSVHAVASAAPGTGWSQGRGCRIFRYDRLPAACGGEHRRQGSGCPATGASGSIRAHGPPSHRSPRC